jgi:hypothetical protein
MNTTIRFKCVCVAALFLAVLSVGQVVNATITGTIQNASCIDSDCGNCYFMTTTGGTPTGIITCYAVTSTASANINTCHTATGQCTATSQKVANCGGTLTATKCAPPGTDFVCGCNCGAGGAKLGTSFVPVCQ